MSTTEGRIALSLTTWRLAPWTVAWLTASVTLLVLGTVRTDRVLQLVGIGGVIVLWSANGVATAASIRRGDAGPAPSRPLLNRHILLGLVAIAAPVLAGVGLLVGVVLGLVTTVGVVRGALAGAAVGLLVGVVSVLVSALGSAVRHLARRALEPASPPAPVSAPSRVGVSIPERAFVLMLCASASASAGLTLGVSGVVRSDAVELVLGAVLLAVSFPLAWSMFRDLRRGPASD